MRADRLVAIMLRLQNAGYVTTADLAQEFEVSRRTILRDVQALSTAGIPVYAQPGPGGGIALDENYQVSLTGLNEAELRALYLSGNLKLLTEIGLKAANQSLLSKFGTVLPETQAKLLTELRQRIYIDSTWWVDSEAPPFLERILEAADRDLCLEAVYETYNGKRGKRLLQPYGLVAKGGTWYLVATRKGRLRIYRVSRFHEVTVLPEHFVRSQDFDLVSYWHENIQAFVDSLLQYQFTLKIRNHRKDFVRRYSTGRYQVIQSNSVRGWFMARFKVETMEPAMMLVFGLGVDAEVIEPEELRAAVKKRSQEMEG